MWPIPFHRWRNYGRASSYFPRFALESQGFEPTLSSSCPGSPTALPGLASEKGPPHLSHRATLIHILSRGAGAESSEIGRRAAHTHLPLALSQLLRLALLGLQDLLHLGVEGQVPGVTLRRERPQALGAASQPQPGSTFTPPGPGGGGAGSQKKGSRDNCPGSGLDCGHKETEAQRVGWTPGDRARPTKRGWR